MAEITNEALYAAIESVAQSIGKNATARMHMAIARMNGESAKPAHPERIYPSCGLTPDEATRLYASVRDISRSSNDLDKFADTILRRACDAGQVVTREEFDRAVGDRKARDMAVAKEVVESLCWVLEPAVAHRFDEDYLAPVIARVKP